MKVLLNPECTELLKELRSESTLDSRFTSKTEIPLKPVLKKRGSFHLPQSLSVPKLRNLKSDLKPELSIQKVEVKSPQIKVSPEIFQKIRKARTKNIENPKENEENNEIIPQPRFFITGDNQNNNLLAILLKKRMEKRVQKDGAAEIEYKYQKVLERHNLHIEKRKKILRNIRKKSEILEIQNQEQADRLQKFLDGEIESYKSLFKESTRKFRRQEAVLHLLSKKYSKSWENNGTVTMSVPKIIKPKYEDATKQNSEKIEEDFHFH